MQSLRVIVRYGQQSAEGYAVLRYKCVPGLFVQDKWDAVPGLRWNLRETYEVCDQLRDLGLTRKDQFIEAPRISELQQCVEVFIKYDSSLKIAF